MIFNNVRIESMAYALPDEVWSSATIEQQLTGLYERLRLPLGRLEHMTGIRERRFWSRPVSASEASAMAGEAVLKKTRFKAKDFDILMHTSVCRDRLEPATASYVHRRLGMGPQTQIFDLSNACLGWLNAVSVAGAMIEAGTIKRALLVAGENGRPLVETTISTLLNTGLTRQSIKPFFANLTIGAGSVAAVLCHASEAPDDAPAVLGGAVETDTSHNNLCEGGAGVGDGLVMQTDSEQLLLAGLDVGGRAWDRFKNTLNWTNETPDRVICHQVGKAHMDRLLQRLHLNPLKNFTTFESLGNIGSVSVPITLAMGVEKAFIKAGDKVALLGIGSGLSSMMMGLRWGKLQG